MTSPDGFLRSRALAPGLLESIWRYRYAVVIVALLGGLAGFAYSQLRPAVYESTARILLADPSTTVLFDEIRVTADTTRYVRNQAEFIRTGAVYPRASELVGGRRSPLDISELVTVEVRADVDLISITAIEARPEWAAGLANAVVEAYEEVVAERVQGTAAEAVGELEARNDALREEIRVLEAPAAAPNSPAEAEREAALQQISNNENRISQLQVDAALFGSGIETVGPALEPVAPSYPRPVRAIPFGFLLGALLSSGVAWWRNGVSRVVDRSSDPSPVLDAPLLGEIPVFSRSGFKDELPTLSAPWSTAAEAYQFVMSSLGFALAEAGGKTVLVTSPRPGDGKTVTTLNLAVAARRDDRQVVLVDTDKRVLGLTERCGVDEAAVFRRREPDARPFDWRRTQVELSDDVTVTLFSVGMDVDDPASYFRTGAFRRALERVKQSGDLVLLDSPPLLAVSETSAIAGQVDGIVLVIDRGTPVTVLAEVRRRLEFIGTPVLGYVFNHAQAKASVYGYVRGEYGYGNHQREQRAERGSSQRSWFTPQTIVGRGRRQPPQAS